MRVIHHENLFSRRFRPRHGTVLRVPLDRPRARQGCDFRHVPVRVVSGNERFPARDFRILIQRVRGINERRSRFRRRLAVADRVETIRVIIRRIRVGNRRDKLRTRVVAARNRFRRLHHRAGLRKRNAPTERIVPVSVLRYHAPVHRVLHAREQIAGALVAPFRRRSVRIRCSFISQF